MMTKYKTEKRKANVGERILITNAIETGGYYAEGSVSKVSSAVSGGVFVDEHIRAVLHEEYEVIVESKPSKSERISLLESQVAELQAQVEALQKRRKSAVALTQTPTIYNVTINEVGANSDKTAKQLAEVFRKFSEEYGGNKPTPNERRKAVIERAKAFVKDTINEYQLSDSEISFEVDAKKRSVYVTLSHLFSGMALAKAVAKCAPDDVFNADIGKAIALGRALGLEPAEFYDAPTPTEIVEGQRVYISEKYPSELVGTAHNASQHLIGIHCATYWHRHEHVTIIDDTEAQY